MSCAFYTSLLKDHQILSAAVAGQNKESNTRKKEERERAGGDDPDILVLDFIGGENSSDWYRDQWGVRK